jgi:hypothetical protein
LIGELSAEKSKKLGMDRRKFMATSMGMATCFAGMNIEKPTRKGWPSGHPTSSFEPAMSESELVHRSVI